MKNVRNFTDFVKNRVFENSEPIDNPIDGEMEDGLESTYENEIDDTSNLIDEPEIDDIENKEEEEDGSEYKGTKLMEELADMLDTEIKDNEIEYNGHTVNFFSETEKFHVDDQKFETPEEVYNYLDNPESIKESRKYSKRRK